MYVSFLAPTGTPRSVRIFNIQQTNIVLEASPPVDTLQNGLITSYTILITDTVANTTMNYSLTIPMPIHPITESINITVFMLSPLTNYSVTVSAVNSAGTGPLSVAVIFRTLPFRKLQYVLQWIHPHIRIYL